MICVRGLVLPSYATAACNRSRSNLNHVQLANVGGGWMVFIFIISTDAIKPE